MLTLSPRLLVRDHTEVDLMAMGRRGKQEHQEALFVTTDALPRAPRHVFYERLNRILAEHDFDRFVEDSCRSFYADKIRTSGSGPRRHLLPHVVRQLL